jgi:hypothetical protein
MTLTVSPPRSAPIRPSRRRDARPSLWPEHASGHSEHEVLGQYVDSEGRSHEIVSRSAAGGSTLVVDRNTVTFSDRRLVAHLGADEPRDNARLLCEQYIADTRGRWCRRLTNDDLAAVPFPEDEDIQDNESRLSAETSTLLIDAHNRSYCLELVSTRMSIPEVRWQQCPPDGQAGPARVISVRDVIACLESYEPIRALTRGALARYRQDSKVSVSVLRGEMERICASRIVLNRGLREAVLHTVETKGLSMSEIAMRCGRVKYDSRGNVSGETSWLSRRLGLAPEGGEHSPTPWVHSDVLALIARRGLGISPQEVELG